MKRRKLEHIWVCGFHTFRLKADAVGFKEVFGLDDPVRRFVEAPVREKRKQHGR